MPNIIPSATRKAVYERSRRLGKTPVEKCELCQSLTVDGIHHIIPRWKRIHRAETLILTNTRCHDNPLIQKMLQMALQEFYLERFDEEIVRELMGGMLYMWEVEPTALVREHFTRVKLSDEVYEIVEGVVQ